MVLHIKFKVVIAVLFSLNLLTGYGYAQYSISGRSQNGKNLNSNDVIIENDSCTFFVHDKNGNIVLFIHNEWSLEGLNTNSVYIPILNMVNTDLPEFNVLDIDNNIWGTLKKCTLENDSSVYYSAKIKCIGATVSKESINLEIPVYLNLLPSRPIVEIRDIHFNFDISVPNNWGTGFISLKFHSERAKEYRVVVKTYDKDGLTSNSNYLCSLQKADNYIVEFNSPFEEGEYNTISVLPVNKFGTPAINNIIYIDNKIRTSLENAITTGNIQIYPNPIKDILSLIGDLEPIASLLFIDVTGRIVKEIRELKNTSLDLSSMSSGVYALIVQYKNHFKKESIKLIKY